MVLGSLDIGGATVMGSRVWQVLRSPSGLNEDNPLIRLHEAGDTFLFDLHLRVIM